MSAPFKAIAMFVCIMVLGSAALATIDAFVLGNIDGKLAHDSQGQFMLVFVLGLFLTAGSVVPVAIAAFALRRRVGRWPVLFAIAAAAMALGILVTQAYVPLAEWLEPVMPRSALYPLLVSMVIGVACAVVASAVCFVHKGTTGA